MVKKALSQIMPYSYVFYLFHYEQNTWACETGNHDKGNVKSHEWAWSKLSIIENESKGELRVASYGTSTGQNKAEEKQQENGENIPQK